MPILNLPTLVSRILFVGLIAIGFIATSANAEELTPQQALEKFAKSVELVKTYDVTLSETLTRKMKLVTEMLDGKRVGHYEPYPDGETPFVKKSQGRQVTKDNDSFRMEEFDIETGKLHRTMAIAGQRMLWLETNQSGNQFAFVDVRTKPQVLRLLRDGRHYGTFFVNAYESIPWFKVFSERTKVLRVADDKSPTLYVIESAYEPEAGEQPVLGVRLALDPQNGYLPAWLETHTANFERLSMRTEILEWKELPVGISVPTKVKATRFVPGARSQYAGQPVEIAEYEVDLEKSRWNCELDANIFTLQFPPGVFVSDQIKAREQALMNPRLPQPRFIPRKDDEMAK